MKIKNFWPFILMMILFISPLPAHADGIVIPSPPICDPGPCPPEPFPISQLEIRYHHVDVKIEDQIAVTQVDQVFFNPNDWVVEGTYMFPIPKGASITGFTLWMDGQPVEAEILDADQARSTYEEIVREMQDPALLEYIDQGAVQARIFPIPPQGESRIELEYSQLLTSENGLVRYIYPLNTEKFSTQPLDEVRISLDIRAAMPIRAAYSPTHPVDINQESRYHLIAGYEEYNLKPDADFAFYYSIGEEEAFHLLSYWDPGDEEDSYGFFTLLLAPRTDAGSEVLPKDVLLILDRSGSMEGEKFQQAQEALRYVLSHLNEEDRFNLVAFSTSIDSFADGMQSVSEVEQAVAWVDRLSAAGSTDINRALMEAVTMSNRERPTYLIFLTDGLPTEGEVDSGDILHNLDRFASDNIRLFAFGVGYDVDTFLLDSLAENHHGTSTYVLPGEKIDEILSGFYAKISTPILTNLSLDFGDVPVFDIYPSPLPDLFEGSQIILVGRYREGGLTDVILKGEINNQVQTFTFPDQHFISDSLSAGVEASNLHFIPRLWATRKIGYLLTQIRLRGPNQEIIDQIVRISIRFGIVTPYTSYLVTEPMPLGISEQDRIAEEQFRDLEAEGAAPSYGQDAVEKAAGQGALENSDLASAPRSEAENKIRIVGSRTFVFSDGTWVDTAFDPEMMETVKVAFLSEDYFNLVSSRPNLAAAFALGDRVIALSEGVAYEVVDQSLDVDPIDLLDPIIQDETSNNGVQDDPSSEDPGQQDASNPNQTISDPAIRPSSERENFESFPCLNGLVPLAFLAFSFVFLHVWKE